MPRIFSKWGFWLFLLAVVWYFAANFALGKINQNNIAYAKSQHQTEQQFDLGERKKVVIRAPDKDFSVGTIRLVFDPDIAQASIVNKNLSITTSGKWIDDVFNITLDTVRTKLSDRDDQLTILLPSAVNKVGFSGRYTVEVEGHLPIAAAGLNLDILDCAPTLNTEKLIVNKLKLSRTCLDSHYNRYAATDINIGKETQINRLELSMKNGGFSFDSNTIPQQILLQLGEDVQISANSQFLKNAKFGNQF